MEVPGEVVEESKKAVIEEELTDSIEESGEVLMKS